MMIVAMSWQDYQHFGPNIIKRFLIMDNYDLFHSKRFSVGLNMENSQEDILTFLRNIRIC